MSAEGDAATKLGCRRAVAAHFSETVFSFHLTLVDVFLEIVEPLKESGTRPEKVPGGPSKRCTDPGGTAEGGPGGEPAAQEIQATKNTQTKT